VIELVTPARTDRYTVDKIEIVRPDNVSVLQPRPMRSLTLVTCYPFYLIGRAPQRFIVQASAPNSDSTQALEH
jgi:sortase A